MTRVVGEERPKAATHVILLDLVRFLSAILVMAMHLGFWGWWKNGDGVGTIGRLFPSYPQYPELISFTWFGWVGVQTFFVISGFVIAMTAEKSSALQFLRSRFLRVYPVAWICATISFIIVVATANKPPGCTIALRYINTLLITPYPAWIDGVYWTLALELVFYGLAFLIIATGRRQNLVCLGIALGFVSTFYIAGLASTLLPGGWVFTLMLLRHGVFFSIGMLIFDLSKRHCAVLWPKVAFLALFTGMGIIEILHTAITKLEALNLTAPLYPPVVAWLFMLCCILVSGIWTEAFNRRLFPARHVLRVLGLATYPLYLIHQTVGGAMGTFVADVGLDRGLALLAAMSSSIATSIAIAMLLEPGIRRFAAGLFDSIVSGLPTCKLLCGRKH